MLRCDWVVYLGVYRNGVKGDDYDDGSGGGCWLYRFVLECVIRVMMVRGFFVILGEVYVVICLLNFWY